MICDCIKKPQTKPKPNRNEWGGCPKSWGVELGQVFPPLGAARAGRAAQNWLQPPGTTAAALIGRTGRGMMSSSLKGKTRRK